MKASYQETGMRSCSTGVANVIATIIELQDRERQSKKDSPQKDKTMIRLAVGTVLVGVQEVLSADAKIYSVVKFDQSKTRSIKIILVSREKAIQIFKRKLPYMRL